MIKFENISFQYGEEETTANGIHDINITINTGEFVVICGKSGCGKTTLTRIINGLIPHFYEGRLTGKVTIDGQEVGKEPLSKIARSVGSVFQNPRSQFFNVNTTGELAFGCENLGLETEEIWRRIKEATEKFDISHLLDRSIFELSGGEKQRIACASIYAVHPDVFVLDEPSSNLDAESIERLRQVLLKLKKEGKTIVVSEHRLYYLAGLMDRLVYMNNGCIERVYSADEISLFKKEELEEKGLRCLEPNKITNNQHRLKPEPGEVLKICPMICEYNRKTILSIPELTLNKGEIIAVIGPNGAGKSTFAGCLCGIQKHKGKVFMNNKSVNPKERLRNSYMVMQDVNHQLFTESVLEEVTLGTKKISREAAQNILDGLDLHDYVERHPLTLSGGQKQRVAIAGAICAEKHFLIYDEPTSGLDFHSMRTTCNLIRTASKDTFLSIVITHDLEFIMECCTSILHICAGRIFDYYPLNETGLRKVKDFFKTDSYGIG